MEKWREKNRIRVHVCINTSMKHKVGMETEGGSKKGKGVGNESPLSCMFQKQQTVNY